MLGVFLDLRSMDHDDLDLSALRATMPEWQFYDHTTPAQTAQRIAEADVVISNKVLIDAAALQSATRLKLICVAATGYNNIDLHACGERKIKVCNARGYATPSVAQHVMTMILALSTNLISYTQAATNGRWSSQRQFCLLDFPITELAGKTLGIIGMGTLGSAVATLGSAFGMKVIAWQRPGAPTQPGRMALEPLLRTADVVSLHSPLTEQTADLIGAEQLRQLGPEGLLINTARGGIVDEAALLHALTTGQLGGAAVDVFAPEPPRADHPLLTAKLANLIVTPHNAWASRESRQRLAQDLAQNVQAFLSGSIRNEVKADGRHP